MTATAYDRDVDNVTIVTDTARLPGMLTVPRDARGTVVFAHGSGSSRFSRRNLEVATALNVNRYATLLFDLLSADENAEDEVTRQHRFNIPLLASRLVAAVDHAQAEGTLHTLPLGLFGASTGAAAALIAAAERPDAVRAVVSRGGRPDLAGEALTRVTSPVLFLAGGRDAAVVDFNRRAATQLESVHRVIVVPDASHLFEEPGKLEEVQRLALDWFDEWLAK